MPRKMNKSNRKMSPKKDWQWPWTPKEELVWGRQIIANHGEITHLDRVMHQALVTNQPHPPEGISEEDFLIAATRKMGIRNQPRPAAAAAAAAAAEPGVVLSNREKKMINKSERKESLMIHEKRMAGLRESRKNEPNVSHKNRLAQLKAFDAPLWGNASEGAFKKLIGKDNQQKTRATTAAATTTVAPPKTKKDNQQTRVAVLPSQQTKAEVLPPGTFRVPVKPSQKCPYPCQLCGTPLRAGVYEVENIVFCSPGGGTEFNSLQWALDSKLYNDNKSTIIACNCCDPPKPWGTGPPITAFSLSTDYGPYLDEYDDDYEYDCFEEANGFHQDALQFGFSEDDTRELLSLGIKPWESDAHDVLAALRGCEDYY